MATDYTANEPSLTKCIIGIGQETTAGSAVTPTVFPVLLLDESCENKPLYESQEAITGGFASESERMLHTANVLDVAFSFLARPGELLLLLQQAMGKTAGGGAMDGSRDGTLKPITVEVDRLHEVLTYAGVRVDTLTISSRANEAMRVDVTGIAMSCVRGTTPTSPTGLWSSDAVLRHGDLALTVDANTYAVNGIEIKIENNMDREARANSVNRLAIPYGPRVVTCSLEMDWNATNKASFQDNLHTPATVAVTAVWSRSAKGLTVALPKLWLTGDQPAGKGRGHWRWSVVGTAMASVIGEDDEISMTLDTTA